MASQGSTLGNGCLRNISSPALIGFAHFLFHKMDQKLRAVDGKGFNDDLAFHQSQMV